MLPIFCVYHEKLAPIEGISGVSVLLHRVFVTGAYFFIPENMKLFTYLIGDLKQYFRKYCILGKENHSQNIITSYWNPIFS